MNRVRLHAALAAAVICACPLHARQEVKVSFQCKGQQAGSICKDTVKAANNSVVALDRAVVERIVKVLQRKYEYFTFAYAQVASDNEPLCAHIRIVLEWPAKTKQPKLNLEVYRWLPKCSFQDFTFSDPLPLDLADSSNNPGADSWPEIVETSFADYLRPIKAKAAVLDVIPLGAKATLQTPWPDDDKPPPSEVLAFLPIGDSTFLKQHFNEAFLIRYRSEVYGDQVLRTVGLSCTEKEKQTGLLVRAEGFVERKPETREIPYEPKKEHRDRIGTLSDNTFFLYLDAVPRAHGDACPKYRTNVAVDTGTGTGTN